MQRLFSSGNDMAELKRRRRNEGKVKQVEFTPKQSGLMTLL